MSFEVACPPEDAFDTWTRRFGVWWPADHTVSGDPQQVALEPRLGGRIHERPDGTEHEWGEVTVWEPPHRLGYRWHLRRDRADATLLPHYVHAVEPAADATIHWHEEEDHD